jgi:hypothetical protein
MPNSMKLNYVLAIEDEHLLIEIKNHVFKASQDVVGSPFILALTPSTTITNVVFVRGLKYKALPDGHNWEVELELITR